LLILKKEKKNTKLGPFLIKIIKFLVFFLVKMPKKPIFSN